MSKPSAPSMPTQLQVEKAVEVVSALNPAARVARMGPDGVSFDYPDTYAPFSDHQGKPFGGKP